MLVCKSAGSIPFLRQQLVIDCLGLGYCDYKNMSYCISSDSLQSIMSVELWQSV